VVVDTALLMTFVMSFMFCIVTKRFVYQPEGVGPATICNHMMIRHECAYTLHVADIQVAWYRVT